MNTRKGRGAALALFALATLGSTLAPPATVPAAAADPGFCEGGGGWGSFGSRCDSPPAPDGSFEQCDRVNVLGWGGMNCYRVYPNR